MLPHTHVRVHTHTHTHAHTHTHTHAHAHTHTHTPSSPSLSHPQYEFHSFVMRTDKVWGVRYIDLNIIAYVY